MRFRPATTGIRPRTEPWAPHYVPCTCMYPSQCPCHALYHESKGGPLIHCGPVARYSMAGILDLRCSALRASFVSALQDA